MVEQVRDMQRKRRSEQALPTFASDEVSAAPAASDFDWFGVLLAFSLILNVILVGALVLL